MLNQFEIFFNTLCLSLVSKLVDVWDVPQAIGKGFSMLPSLTCCHLTRYKPKAQWGDATCPISRNLLQQSPLWSPALEGISVLVEPCDYLPNASGLPMFLT